ncbi:immunoglobulin-binding protein 1 isoform X2 [Nilaparvata lugens]|nr:immunoglobulin-binding protein 1 isoform X2 [Nilaparvata lugens]
MAASDEIEDIQKLSGLFDEGWDLFQKINDTKEATNSLNVQRDVKRCMQILENATQLTSLASVFSSNESIEEIATNDVKLLLLPALLGSLTLNLCNRERERSEIVQTAEIYFRDFLQRCKDYSVGGEFEIPAPRPVDDVEDDARAANDGRPKPMFDMEGAARRRASKIKQYHEQKALDAEIESMRQALKTSDNEEMKRKYYLNVIRSYVSKALEDLDALEAEKQILKFMAKAVKDGEVPAREERRKGGNHPQPKPLRPIIITRDEVQKKVFGLGYPSLPTMTVQEFYDKRVRDGDFPDPGQMKERCLQDIASKENARDAEEEERAEKERKEESDDADYLARARRMDEYKDEHRRGEGNRYNRS